MIRAEQIPTRLLELWLTICHRGLCRPLDGGLLVWLPADQRGFGHTKLAIHLQPEASEAIAAESKRVFGDDCRLLTPSLDLANTSELGLGRILSELQEALLEPDTQLPADAQFLAYLLKEAEYRSPHLPLARTVYHVVPQEQGWLLKLQGEDHGESFERKEDAVKAGAGRARSHPSGQLVVHLGNGQFEECRTYGEPARE